MLGKDKKRQVILNILCLAHEEFFGWRREMKQDKENNMFW